MLVNSICQAYLHHKLDIVVCCPQHLCQVGNWIYEGFTAASPD